MEKTNGHHPSTTLVIPKIIYTDYDAELARQQEMNQETETTNVGDPAIVQGPDVSPNGSIVNESEEEDREIIDSLTKAHSNKFEVHVDVNVVASTVSNNEKSRPNFVPNTVIEFSEPEKTELLPEKKELLSTDDEMADLEVSHITSLLESTNTFVPLSNSILKLQRPTASLVPVPPPGALPNISDVVQRVPRTGESSSTDPYDFLAKANFQPLAPMSFSVGVSRFDRNECLPTNGANNMKNRKTARLTGESDSDSHCSSGSDEQPPEYWKLYDNVTTEKSDGGSKEDMNQILNTYHVVDGAVAVDNNTPSTSTNFEQFEILPKETEDEN